MRVERWRGSEKVRGSRKETDGEEQRERGSEMENKGKKRRLWRQRGRVVRAPDLKSGGHGFKSRSDHLAGVVSRWTPVQLLGHACI